MHSIDPSSLACAGADVVGAVDSPSMVGFDDGVDDGVVVDGNQVGAAVVGLGLGLEVGASLGTLVGEAVARQPSELLTQII